LPLNQTIDGVTVAGLHFGMKNQHHIKGQNEMQVKRKSAAEFQENQLFSQIIKFKT
jgi:hypothetical protein